VSNCINDIQYLKQEHPEVWKALFDLAHGYTLYESADHQSISRSRLEGKVQWAKKKFNFRTYYELLANAIFSGVIDP